MTIDNQSDLPVPQPGQEIYNNTRQQNSQQPSFSHNNPAYQYGQNPASLPGPMPNHNPAYQYGPNPASLPGSMPNHNPAYQYGQNPASLPGPMPNHNPAYQYGPNPASLPGPMPASNPGFQYRQASSFPQAPDYKKARVSRRNIFKISAIVGGALVAAGGAAVATQHLITPTTPTTPSSTLQQSPGKLREYWVQADAFIHNLVPTNKDGMMGMAFTPEQSSFWAVGYRVYTPNWGQLLAGNDDIGPNTGIPGPVFRGSVGDTIRVHFRNNDTHYRTPHSMHPHGVLYTPANDGAWIASDPQPGAMVAPGQSYTYDWHVHPNSVGTWIYHDHSVSSMAGANMLMEFGAEVGLFGFLVLTDASTRPATKEFFTFLHDIYQADIASLSQDYDCFNGFSYLGNTPTFNAKVGDTIRWHIGALGKEFHAFHLHGHRWSSNGQFVDVVQLGPSNATSFDFVADNPGKWLYHCHVTDHMMGGMIGMYEIHA